MGAAPPDQPKPQDLIVILPGLLGSELSTPDGSGRLWGVGGVLRTAIGSGLSLEKTVERLTDALALEPSADPERPPKVQAGLLRVPALLSGFWAVAGYDKLCRKLHRRFGERVLAYPYDWRESNQVTAHRLAAWLKPRIDKARRQHGDKVGVIFVGHSMGGLVARWFAEKLDRDEVTKQIITVGTPYRGAIKALEVLANGSVHLGPLTLKIGDLVASWPSVVELLPSYNCIAPPGADLGHTKPSDLVPLGEDSDIGSLSVAQIRAGRAFHAELSGGSSAGLYVPLLSGVQPTPDWATISGAGSQANVTTHGWTDPRWEQHQGDGTVPRRSASPPEWERDVHAPANLPGRHATLHQTKPAIEQVAHVISGHDPAAPMGQTDVAVDAPTFAEPKQPLEVVARYGGIGLNLDVTVRDDGENVVKRASMKRGPDGVYQATVTLEEPGIYQWEVASPCALGVVQIQAVSDVVMCASAR